MTGRTIAVAIPSYNRPGFLLELTRSLPDYVPISVSDNGGSMAGMSIGFGVNVRVHHADRQVPIFENWNRALSFLPINSTHVLIPSDDDLYLPEALQTVVAGLDRHPDADTIVFGCDLVDEHGKIRTGWCPTQERRCEPGDGFHVFERGVSARMPGVLFRKAFLDEIGAFDERFELTAADSELIQRATLLGRTVFIPATIGLYRVWSGSLTNARQATDLWMSEISMWTDKIAQLLHNGHQPVGRRVNVKRYKAEIFAQNLLAGINNLRAKGELAEVNEFLKRHKFPASARMKTRLRFLRSRLAIWIAAR